MGKELMYNKSGIKDITAYKAITNLCKGENKTMQTKVNKGDIWEVYNGFVVIINCFERYATVVMLQEKEPEQNAVTVRVQDIMYADAGRLAYVYYDKMYEYVRKLGEGEEEALRKAVRKALELDVTEYIENAPMENLDAARKEIAILRQELKEKKEELEEAYDQMEENARMAEAYAERAGKAEQRAKELETEVVYQDTVEDYALREELAAAQREAEIYKKLYEDMLARALG